MISLPDFIDCHNFTEDFIDILKRTPIFAFGKNLDNIVERNLLLFPDIYIQE
jgi:hypothetical protein